MYTILASLGLKSKTMISYFYLIKIAVCVICMYIGCIDAFLMRVKKLYQILPYWTSDN